MSATKGFTFNQSIDKRKIKKKMLKLHIFLYFMIRFYIKNFKNHSVYRIHLFFCYVNILLTKLDIFILLFLIF